MSSPSADHWPLPPEQDPHPLNVPAKVVAIGATTMTLLEVMLPGFQMSDHPLERPGWFLLAMAAALVAGRTE